MKLIFLHKDWKSWSSILGLTAFLLLFGVAQFQHSLSTWLFAACFLAVNWIVYTLVYSVSLRFNWNQNHLLNAAKHVIFACVSAGVVFLIIPINSNFYIAYFSGFLIVGVVFSSFDFVLSALEELVVLRSNPSVSVANTIEKEHRFQLKNTKGKTTFDQQTDHIVCFEANDNYLTIYYMENELCKKTTERLAISKAEEMIQLVSNDFLRVHKSFIVNKNHVQSIQGKAQNHRLKVHGLSEEIPVSRRLNVHQFFPNLN